MARTIKLTQGYKTFVDAKEYKRVNRFKWHARVDRNKKDGSIKNVYAIRNVPKHNGTFIWLHRFILRTKARVDHRDHDGLNNRRKNLRKATNAQNVMNGKTRSDNTSGIKGVHWCQRLAKWIVQVSIKGTWTHVGVFTTLPQAKKARAHAAKEQYGEFACN